MDSNRILTNEEQCEALCSGCCQMKYKACMRINLKRLTEAQDTKTTKAKDTEWEAKIKAEREWIVKEIEKLMKQAELTQNNTHFSDDPAYGKHRYVIGLSVMMKLHDDITDLYEKMLKGEI